MGDTSRDIAEAVNRFFIMWKDLLLALFSRAKTMGLLRPDADPDALADVVICGLEGALLIAKASKDVGRFRNMTDNLKAVINSYRA